MEKQMPVESEGQGAIAGGGFVIGAVSGVNDESARLVEDFKPTQYELEVLARRYLDEIRNNEFWWEFLKSTGTYKRERFVLRRLATIEAALGKERFQEAIASTKEEWKREFAMMEEFVKNLEPCKACGEKRTYEDYLMDTGGYCAPCVSASRQAEGRYDQPGLPFTVTEELRAEADQWTQ